MSEDKVKEACTSYAKRQDGDFPVILTQLQRQRLKALTLWVKDMVRAQLPVEFTDGLANAEVNDALADALSRESLRKEQRKVGESYHDHTFNNKLKSQSQWEKFNEELEATLSLIIGSQGVTINYVICQDEVPDFDPAVPFKQALIQAVTLDGPKYQIDARTVHWLILHNVHEDSDAYTYIKPLLRYQDGRRDMLALREQYASKAAKQTIINAAKASLENL